MAVPIFVLGLQRSGTTWIANLLAGADAVAAVAANEHRGVHESIFFSHFATAFGPFADADARAKFRAAFAASDYFLLSGLPETVLDNAIAQSTDYEGVFAAVMDALAAKDGCTYWLEKSPHHTLLAEQLAQRFPAALFVCVTRSSSALLASRFAIDGRTPPRGLKRAADIMRGSLTNALYVRRLRRFAAGCDRALLVRYDTFVENERGGKRMLSDFLGPGITPETMQSRFAPNSSHGQRRTRHLSTADRLLVALGDGMGRLLPLALLGAIEERRRRSRGLQWPDWVWAKSDFHVM